MDETTSGGLVHSGGVNVRSENELKSCLKNILRSKRSEINISQEKMAERIGISTREYNNLENGKSFCSAYALINFINNCEVDKDEFFSKFAEIIDK